MSSPSDTTVIFVPGAWHGPGCFDLVADKLRTKGYNVDYVHLASVGATPPLEDFHPDVDIIRKHTTKAVDAGQRVVMVMHSYGGVPASDAVHGLDFATRKAAGLPGGVVHMFFCCSFLVPVGTSVQSALGGGDVPWQDITPDRKETRPIGPEDIFYNGLPEDVVKDCVSKLKPQSYQAFCTEVRYAMWTKIPSTYLYCLQDHAIPIFVQELMVKEWAGGAGVNIRTETLDTCHSPFLSMPGETAAAIERAATLET